LLLRPWRSLGGDSEFALRYPSALFGALAVPCGFVLARQLGFSRRIGLLLGLLLATSPYLVWYGQEAKMYTLLLVLVSIAFIAYLKALTPTPALPLTPLAPSGVSEARPARRRAGGGLGWGWWIVFVAATTLSFYTHILSPLMLPVYGLVALLHPADLRRQRWGWLISMSCLWLVVSEEDIWDSRHLTRAWLDAHAHLVDQASFTRVDVYHYRFQPGAVETQSVRSNDESLMILEAQEGTRRE
jgi:uncharacterized membrane protein